MKNVEALSCTISLAAWCQCVWPNLLFPLCISHYSLLQKSC